MAYDIHSALEKLEQNLKNVDSARKQVNSVVASNNELHGIVEKYTETMHATYKELKKWMADLQKQSQQVSLEYVETVQHLNTSCNTIIDTFKKASDVAAKGFVSLTDGPLTDFDKSNKLFAKSIAQLTDLYADFKKATNEVLSIKDSLTQISKDLKASQQDQDKELTKIKGEIAKFISLFNDSSNEIQKTCASINNVVSALSVLVSNANNKVDILNKNVNGLEKICIAARNSTEEKIQSLTKSVDGLEKTCIAARNSTEEKIQSLQDDLTKSVNINRWFIIGAIVIMIVLKFIGR